MHQCMYVSMYVCFESGTSKTKVCIFLQYVGLAKNGVNDYYGIRYVCMYVYEAYRAKLVHVSCHSELASGGLDESRDDLTSACCKLL